jgi:hypothetical protein
LSEFWTLYEMLQKLIVETAKNVEEAVGASILEMITSAIA